jgi:hypothetical protein
VAYFIHFSSAINHSARASEGKNEIAPGSKVLPCVLVQREMAEPFSRIRMNGADEQVPVSHP